jgi:hypothetical protein
VIVFEQKTTIMSNRFSDILFQLIHSLEKAEKRHFKLYIKRSSAKEDLKIVQLFDAIDKAQEADDAILMKKIAGITKPQLANLKTHLYKQVLASLRLLKSTDTIDLQLTEQLDYARILYNKGLKIQALTHIGESQGAGQDTPEIQFSCSGIVIGKKDRNTAYYQELYRKNGTAGTGVHGNKRACLQGNKTVQPWHCCYTDGM